MVKHDTTKYGPFAGQIENLSAASLDELVAEVRAAPLGTPFGVVHVASKPRTWLFHDDAGRRAYLRHLQDARVKRVKCEAESERADRERRRAEAWAADAPARALRHAENDKQRERENANDPGSG